MHKTIAIFILLICNILILSEVRAQVGTMDAHNITWTTPGVNSQGKLIEHFAQKN